MATAARGTVIIGSGLALGILTAHMYGQAALSATAADSPAAAAKSAKPKVVTVTRTKHVKSDPIIVYREVPAGSTGGSYVPPSTSGGSSGGGGGYTAPAPSAPKPAAPAAPPAANSGAS